MMNKTYEHTNYFARECGRRIAGTPAVLKASDYIIDYYKQNGIKTETHEFEVPVCNITTSVLRAKAGGKWKEIKHTPALFCGQTPEGGVDYPLVYIENGAPASLKEKDVRGKCVLICRDVYMEYPDVAMYKTLEKYGAAAVIYTTNDGHWDVPYVYANYETMNEEYTIPTAIIHWNTALELLKGGVTDIHLEIRFDIETGKTRSTIGVVEGTDLADEIIVCCAHLDSAAGSTGATDDAAGVGMVMEMARYYNELANNGQRPRRTMRFIAWSGHECGLHGSRNYLQANPEIRKSIKFVFNYDVVGTVLCNYAAIGAFAPSVEEKLNSIINELGYGWMVIQAPMVCDTLNFAADQIPQFTLSSGFFCGNHTEYDDLKLIAPETFVHPLEFTKAVLDWAKDDNVIEQGYDDWMNEAQKAEGERYGWGLFE